MTNTRLVGRKLLVVLVGQNINENIFSCWTNLGSSVAMATFMPVVCLAAATVVIVEASGMGNYRPLPSTNKDQLTAAM